ncbi:MAG: DUF5119 domain-containing protein [bacterium]
MKLNSTKIIIRKLSLILCIIITLVSCQRKPLYDSCICQNTLVIPIAVDWTKSGIVLQNVSVLFYDYYTDELLYQHTYEQNDKDIQSYVALPSGKYKAVIFNEQPNEIDYVSCIDYDNFNTLKFESNGTSPMLSRSTSARGYVEQPGDLAVAVVEEIEITDEMIVEAAQVDDSSSATTKSLTAVTLATVESLMGVVPDKKTCTIEIVAHIKGLNNALMALADLINLADGYYVGSDMNSTVPSSLQFVMNNRVYDDDTKQDGTISATLTAFGTLGDRESISGHDASTPIVLDILFKLVDEDATEYALETDVTNYLSFTEDGTGTITIDIYIAFEEPLPDVEPADSDDGSIFGSSVEDWGETVIVPLS